MLGANICFDANDIMAGSRQQVLLGMMIGNSAHRSGQFYARRHGCLLEFPFDVTARVTVTEK